MKAKVTKKNQAVSRNKDGLKEEYKKTILNILTANPRVERIVLFGSRAMGTYSPESDIDLVLYGDELTLTDLAELKEKLEETTIPQKVDLLLAKDIEKKELLEHIKKHGVEWWRRGDDEERLGDHAEIIMGQSPPGNSVSSKPIGLPLLNGPTEFGHHHPTPVQFTTAVRKRAKPGDILFCVRGSTTGRMNWADQEYAIGRGIAAIRHRNDAFLQPFLKAVIEHELKNLLSQATGSTFPNVSVKQLKGLPFPKLKKIEQRAIAHILGTLDDKIELNRQMNQTLEKMAQAIFKSWFVDFDPVIWKAVKAGNPVPERFAEKAAYYKNGISCPVPEEISALFPDSFEDSELGPIPRGWRVLTFEELVEAKQGKYIPKKEMREFPVKEFIYPVWGGNGIRGYASDYMYNEPVVVMTCRGSNCGLIDMTESPAWISNIAFACRPKYGSTNFIHVYFYYSSFDDCISGSAQPQITYTALKNKRMKYPVHKTICDTYSDQIKDLYEKIFHNNRQYETLSSLRDTLLPKLISGELRVPDAEKFIEEAGE